MNWDDEILKNFNQVFLDNFCSENLRTNVANNLKDIYFKNKDIKQQSEIQQQQQKLNKLILDNLQLTNEVKHLKDLLMEKNKYNQELISENRELYDEIDELQELNENQETKLETQIEINEIYQQINKIQANKINDFKEEIDTLELFRKIDRNHINYLIEQLENQDQDQEENQDQDQEEECNCEDCRENREECDCDCDCDDCDCDDCDCDCDCDDCDCDCDDCDWGELEIYIYKRLSSEDIDDYKNQSSIGKNLGRNLEYGSYYNYLCLNLGKDFRGNFGGKNQGKIISTINHWYKLKQNIDQINKDIIKKYKTITFDLFETYSDDEFNFVE